MKIQMYHIYEDVDRLIANQDQNVIYFKDNTILFLYPFVIVEMVNIFQQKDVFHMVDPCFLTILVTLHL